MRKQRSLFLGQRPGRTPRKDGENPLVPERRCRGLNPDQIEIRFNNTTATQFGGFPLLGRFLERMGGLKAGFARHIKMSRGRLAFTAPELSEFLVIAKILGASRLMHLERFRLDPALTLSLGMDGLPSGKTMGSYLKSFTPGNLGALSNYNTKALRELWKKRYRGQEAPRVILDYDSTTITTYGKQEGADRGRSFRKKDNPGFQPKYAFLAGLGLMVHHRLEPQSHNMNKGFCSFHEETLRKMPKKCRVWGVRGDAALYSYSLIRYFERRRYVYAISAARTPDLQRAILEIPDDAWEETTDEKGRPISIARIRYCPKTWGDRKRTYVISRRLKEDKSQGRLFAGEQYKYFAYVTNFRGPLLSQYLFCVERCSLESYVKEAKGGFDYAMLPCAELNANEAYLGHVQLAYNLAIFFKSGAAPKGVNRWTIATLRARVLCICGNLRQRAGRWLMSLPSWWPYQSVFRQMQQRLALAGP